MKIEDKLIVAGPCAVEDPETMFRIAEELCKLDIEYMRAGAFKPRTHPDSFQGCGREGLRTLARVKRKFGLKIVTEIMDFDDFRAIDNVADVFQIGSRNMQNFALLKKLARTKTRKPILLKRGASATYEELMGARLYLGNLDVVLVERGIRTFETGTRNTFDLNAIPALKIGNPGVQVLADPSHATGRRELVEGVSYGALAAGADGLIIEAHVSPSNALSDANQTIDMKTLARIVKTMRSGYVKL